MSDVANAETGAEATNTAETATSLAALLGDKTETAQTGPTDAEQLAAYMRGEADTPAPEANPLLDLFKDADSKAYIERKGFKSADDIAKSLAHIERLARGEQTGKVVLPTGPDDTEGWERLFAAAGRPESPDGYEFGQLQGADPDFSKAAASWLHGAGVSKVHAAKLAESWNEYVSGRAQAEAQAAEQRATAELAGLRSEWGPQFEAELEAAKRGARQFGLSGDDMEAIGGALGTARAIKLLNSIGKGLAEDTFIDGEGKSQFGMTPEQANARMEALRRDDAWQARWMAGGADEKAEWSRLTSIAAKAQAAA